MEEIARIEIPMEPADFVRALQKAYDMISRQAGEITELREENKRLKDTLVLKCEELGRRRLND